MIDHIIIFDTISRLPVSALPVYLYVPAIDYHESVLKNIP